MEHEKEFPLFPTKFSFKRRRRRKKEISFYQFPFFFSFDGIVECGRWPLHLPSSFLAGLHVLPMPGRRDVADACYSRGSIQLFMRMSLDSSSLIPSAVFVLFFFRLRRISIFYCMPVRRSRRHYRRYAAVCPRPPPSTSVRPSVPSHRAELKWQKRKKNKIKNKNKKIDAAIYIVNRISNFFFFSWRFSLCRWDSDYAFSRLEENFHLHPFPINKQKKNKTNLIFLKSPSRPCALPRFVVVFDSLIADPFSFAGPSRSTKAKYLIVAVDLFPFSF